MPEEETAAKRDTRRWRTIKLADGRTVQVAIVRKSGAKTPAGPVPKDKKKGDNSADKS